MRLSATTYRPDIDGLRAVAVLAVVLFHAFPTVLPGGFVGVDVFFVISGYLISGLLFAALDRGRLDLAGFYARRIRRIFPALLVVMPATVGYGLLVLLPSELAALGKDVAAGAGFVSNLVLWTESGYFDRAASTKPLLHLWSLGVEEQFYLLWPLLLFLLARARRRRVAVVAAAALLSFAAGLALLQWDAAAAFYWPLSRLWELAAGALLAARPTTLPRPSLAAAAGLVAIAAAAALLPPGTAMPGWAALLPVAGACLILAAGPGAEPNRRLLAHPAAVALGRVSYPFYLWHWPPLAYATILRLGRPPTALMAGAILLASLAAAWLTYRFVERPFRFGPRPGRQAGLAFALMALELAAGLALWHAAGRAARTASVRQLDIAQIDAAAAEPIFVPTASMRTENHDETYIARIGAGPVTAILVGDSTMFQYGPRLQRLWAQHRLAGTAIFVVGASCAPVPGIRRTGKFAHCADLPALADAELAAHPAAALILGAVWPTADAGDIERAGRRFPPGSPEGLAAYYANLADAVAAQRRTGRAVYLVLTSPADPRFAPTHLVARSLTGLRIDASPVPVAELRAASAPADAQLRAIAAATGARLLDPVPDACGPGPLCDPVQDGAPKFADARHLRAGFVQDHVTFLDPILAGTPD